ncbi:hypothetical protein CYMTET_14957 [Cymbomonas tetramitiformis]|uniref:C-type lectin domain-containing protein n=1 Tax=Cymbomonas tetramitiformis TaxID=36881 RepID=A0AAE0L9T9_9CHLO|nr:hypothetical protein CYMTET_14957 [Cymbomonas tetramitiformis]
MQLMVEITDVNKDKALGTAELERLRQRSEYDPITKDVYEEMLTYDKNQDGALDTEEVEALQGVHQARKRLEILQYVEDCLAEIIDRKGHYANMFSFILFICFYFAILFYQRRAFLAYDVTFTLSETVLPKASSTEYADSFTTQDQIYDWLAALVDQVWVDPSCGDGVCEPPYEYPSFGPRPDSFGCSADCGVNQFTSAVTLMVIASLWGLGDDETIARFKKETQWNLCTSKKGLQTGVYDMDSIALHNFPLNSITGMRETPPEMEDVALCWWDTWQQLGNAEVVSEMLSLPNAEWKLLLDAPVGGALVSLRDQSSKYDGMIERLNFCRPICSTETPCAAGMYCSMQKPVTPLANRACMPCPKAGELCPSDSTHRTTNCTEACSAGTQLEQLEQQDDLISHSRVPRPAWKTLSFHHICLPMSNSTRDSKVDSVEACKLRCERTPGCRRINVQFNENGDMTLLCDLLTDVCENMESLVSIESYSQASFTLDHGKEETHVTAEHWEANLLRAHSDATCDSHQAKAMLFIHVPEGSCPACFAVQVKAQPPDPTGDASRYSVEGSECAVPFRVHGHVHEDCVWRTDAEAGYRDTVTGQSRWMCPLTADYDPDSIEIGRRFVTLSVSNLEASNSTPMDAHEAQTYCNTVLGTNLVTIRSREEHLALEAHLLTTEKATAGWRDNAWMTWIGLTEVNRTADGEATFLWSDGSRLDSSLANTCLQMRPEYNTTNCGFSINTGGLLEPEIHCTACSQRQPGVAFTCEAPLQQCGLADQMEPPETFAQCDMRGRGFYVEGKDLTPGHHAVELCGLDSDVTYSLQGWDKSGVLGWQGGWAQLVTDGDVWSELISADNTTADGAKCAMAAETNFSLSSLSKRGRFIDQEAKNFLHGRGFEGFVSDLISTPSAEDGACANGTTMVRAMVSTKGAISDVTWGIQDPTGKIDTHHVPPSDIIDYSQKFCLDTNVDGVYRVAVWSSGGGHARVDVVDSLGCALGRADGRSEATCGELGWEEHPLIPGICMFAAEPMNTVPVWEANSYCEDQGARLCTLEEVQVGGGLALGPGREDSLSFSMWTSTPCTTARHGYTVFLHNYNNGYAECVEDVLSTKTPGICCADVIKQEGSATPACPSGGQATCCDPDGDCIFLDDEWCCDGNFFCSTNQQRARAKGGRTCLRGFAPLVGAIHLRTNGERDTGDVSGYDLLGIGHCVVTHWPSPSSHPRAAGVLQETQQIDALQCAAACDSTDLCQAFSFVPTGVCRLYSMVPNRVFPTDEFRGEDAGCYVKIFDGGASCTSSGREYFKETSLRKDLRGCPEDQQFVFQLQAGVYAADMSFQLHKQETAPVSISNDPITSMHATATSRFDHDTKIVSGAPTYLALVPFQHSQPWDLEFMEVQLCLDPGLYGVTHTDNPGKYRFGKGLDKNATNNFMGGAITLYGADSCRVVRMTRPEAYSFPEVMTFYFGSGENYSKWQPTEKEDGLDYFTQAYDGLVCSNPLGTCPFSTEIAGDFQESVPTFMAKYGMAGYMLFEKMFLDERVLGCDSRESFHPHGDHPPNTTNTTIRVFGLTETQQYCSEYSGEIELDLHIPYTGTEGHIPMDDGEARYRYLGIQGANRLLAGMLLTQTRWTPEECESKFTKLSSSCHDLSSSSHQEYGLDPVFLRTSKLYDSMMFSHMCCNVSKYTEDCMPPNCGDFYQASEMAKPMDETCETGCEQQNTGLPYGFFAYDSKFYTFFDVNLSNKRAWDLINYMKDGLFIDANTNQVSVQLITYNSQLRYFGNVDLTFNFDKSRGGLIHVKRSVQTIKIELYETSNDILRACFEVLFAAMIISSAFIECREIWDIVAREKSARTYFKSLWNYIDITSIILSAMIAASWVFFVVTQAQRFSMEPRYEVYAKLESYGRWLKLNGQGEDFQELLDRFQEMSDMTRFQVCAWPVQRDFIGFRRQHPRLPLV